MKWELFRFLNIIFANGFEYTYQMSIHCLKNTRVRILLVLLFWSTTFALNANDILFTSINTSQGLSDNQIRYILQLPDGRMVFTTSGSINLYDGTRFTALHHNTSRDDAYPLKRYKGFYHLYLSNDSLLWIKDYQRLMCIDLRKEQYLADPGSYFRSKGIAQAVEDMYVDLSGRIWLVTPKELVSQDLSFRLKLPHNRGTIQDLMTDNGSLYLFYDTGEVACYDITGGKLLYKVAAYTEDEQKDFRNTSLIVKGKNGFYQLRNGSKGGFFHFDIKKRTWRKLMEKDYALNTLMITADEKAYISCIRGFWIIDLAQGTQQYLPALKIREGNVVATEVSTLFQDKQGALWLGTFNRGLLYYHPAMYKMARIGRNDFPVSQETDIAVTGFAEDKDGNVYLREHAALYKLYVESDGKRTLTPVSPSAVPAEVQKALQPPSPVRFRNKPYTALCTDSRGWIWKGTADGLELFTDSGKEPRRFYSEDGLANNFVKAIIEDRRHDIWVTTGNGISQIHINPANQQIDITDFNRRDGALEGEYMPGAAFESRDGTLYFGGVDGFNRFRPNQGPVLPGLPYPPVFTAFYLYGEKVHPGEAYDNRVILPEAASYTQEIELNYNQNFIAFEFSALNYFNRERTFYRYRLEGIDRDWMVSTGKRDNGILQASYTDLPPGNYMLKVMASDNAHRWNDRQTTQVRLIVRAPYWKTNIAYATYIIFILLIIAASFRLYAHRTKKEMERRHKEEILLLRIRNLIEQCNRYEAGQKVRPEEDKQDTADSTFLTHAIELVEKNLHVSGYSVEQLSRDLCMERTGLYRKLTTMLDQSPSLFIRNIRLQRAAQLILENSLSITEIAEQTGFSSSSYLSKCFQEMYGCRPSEYVEKRKKST